MIKNYLNEKTIQLKQSATDCKDAIRKASAPLVKEGKITEGYIKQMIEALEELGPYMVVLPGVVLAHARPSINVKEECMSLMTLEHAVEFGHKKNDPVHTVFVLASPNKDQHLEELMMISRLLMEEDFIDTLCNSTKVENIIKYFIK